MSSNDFQRLTAALEHFDLEPLMVDPNACMVLGIWRGLKIIAQLEQDVELIYLQVTTEARLQVDQYEFLRRTNQIQAEIKTAKCYLTSDDVIQVSVELWLPPGSEFKAVAERSLGVLAQVAEFLFVKFSQKRPSGRRQPRQMPS